MVPHGAFLHFWPSRFFLLFTAKDYDLHFHGWVHVDILPRMKMAGRVGARFPVGHSISNDARPASTIRLMTFTVPVSRRLGRLSRVVARCDGIA